jgi:hypothetical protein
MSQSYYDDEGDEGGQGSDGPSTNSEHAWKRKQEQARKAAERERDEARKELAFVRAGIDPASKGIASYFVKGYEGDLDPEKIRAAALEAGVIQPPAPDPAEEQRLAQQQADLAAGQRMAGAATAATAAPTVGESQQHSVVEAFQKGGVDAMTAALANLGIAQVEN